MNLQTLFFKRRIMSMLIKMKAIVLVICVLFSSSSVWAQNEKPFVIPELREWQGASGRYLPNTGAHLICESNNPDLLRVVRAFSADYQEMFGVSLPVSFGKAGTGDILFRLKPDRMLPEEGYRVDIDDMVTVSAPTAKGLYWATRTLLQLSEQADDRSLPQGRIVDYPDYHLRGLMIDCGRKYIPISFLRDYVKILAYYKMNTLQVHLNDNGFKQYFQNDWSKTYAAFRLECDTYPGLTAEDGFYTKQEFIDLQILAEEHFVEIIPEIDVPAHSLAFSRYKPEIASKGYGDDHLDLASPATYEFVDALFAEYLGGEQPVFRGKRVNIGTDEYSNRDSLVVEQFRAFTDHYIRFVERFGKQACVWGALTHAKGKTPVKSENVVMNMWHNPYAQPREMLEQGFNQFISIPDGLLYIVPAAGYYYDYLDCRYLYDNWTPAHVADVVFPERDPAILGGMFAVWNDHVGNGISVKDIHHRLYPALQTLAVKMWTASETSLPYVTFDSARHRLSEAPGVNQAGRAGSSPALVCELPILFPGATTSLEEIGYDYTVSFDIKGTPEALGTELFRSTHAVFYLADPVRGLLGFARDGYLFTFNYRIKEGDAAIAIEGDNTSTRLYVDGRLKEELSTTVHFDDLGKGKIRRVPTLVFPLRQAGKFCSQVENLKVYNYNRSKR